MENDARREFSCDERHSNPVKAAAATSALGNGTSPPSHRAFTLVELLVVLALLSTLAALAFSAMGPARERARQRSCASNLHQWGLAFAQYAQDYDGVDAAQGLPSTHAALGLPPGTDAFNFVKSYGIDSTGVMHCPSEHYFTTTHPHTSYYLEGILEDDNVSGYPEIVARVGPNLDLVVCEMHNVDTRFLQQPTWATKWVQSVHIDQHISFKQYNARYFDYDY